MRRRAGRFGRHGRHGLLLAGLAGPALLAVGPAVGFSVGCSVSDPSPQDAARAFVAAVRSRKTAAVLDKLDKPTRDHLAQMAQLATDRVGGRRVIEPGELLQVVSIDPSFDVASSSVIELSEQFARVELTSPAGAVQIVSLVHEEGGWRVQLPALIAPGATEAPAPLAATPEPSGA